MMNTQIKHLIGPAARAAAGILCLLLLLSGGCALADLEPLPVDDSPAPAPAAENFLPDWGGYEDESLSVRFESTRAYDTTILIARVKIAHPSQMRTAMAHRYGSTKNTIPRILTKRMNSVFAVNGDFFSFHGKGYLVRQGQLYRKNPVEEMDMLIIDDKGDFHIIIDPTMEKIEAFEGTMVNTFTFGPALVKDGQPVMDNFQDDIGYYKKTQRMVMAQDGPLSYVFIATEGPENKGSVGLTIEELVEFVGGMNLKNAYNLDGGSSSTMMLGNEKINSLSSGKTRPLCDILYFGTLVR